jgi:hypothetical protein
LQFLISTGLPEQIGQPATQSRKSLFLFKLFKELIQGNMNRKRLLLKIAVLALGLAVLQSMAASIRPMCHQAAVLCRTNNSSAVGTCGLSPAQDCFTCYGNYGSIKANAPECAQF